MKSMNLMSSFVLAWVLRSRMKEVSQRFWLFFFILLWSLSGKAQGLKTPTFSEQVLLDHKAFYSGRGVLLFLPGFALAAGLANSPLDQGVADFYQRKLRSSWTNSLSKAFKPFGDRKVALGFVGSLFLFKVFEKVTGDHFFLRYTKRAFRLLLLGTPPLLFTQLALGGSRPSHDQAHSGWKPFQNSYAVSASGHSFFGAIPFLAGASLVDSLFWKSVLIAFSGLTAFTRINDHQHYLSQALLGWSFAYLSYRALMRSESRFQILPLVSEEEIALGLSFVF